MHSAQALKYPVFVLVTYAYAYTCIILGNCLYLIVCLLHNEMAAILSHVLRGVLSAAGWRARQYPLLPLLISGERKTQRCPAAPGGRQKAARAITIFMTYTVCSKGAFPRFHFV